MHEELHFFCFSKWTTEKFSGGLFHAVLFIRFVCLVLENKNVFRKDQINFLQILCLFVWFCKTKLHF